MKSDGICTSAPDWSPEGCREAKTPAPQIWGRFIIIHLNYMFYGLVYSILPVMSLAKDTVFVVQG
jgi:hypothetical protein